VTHGKEVRARAEKKRESEKQRQNKFIREIILQNFPAPNKSEPDDMRTTVCLAMALYDADIYLSFFSEIEIVKTMKQQIETYFNYRSDWWIKNLHDDICRALAEHIESQEFNLLRQSAFSPTDELLKIQSRLDAASEKRTEAHEEVLRHLENKFSI
jgi:Mg2+ and Co2+ transporter CorA